MALLKKRCAALLKASAGGKASAPKGKAKSKAKCKASAKTKAKAKAKQKALAKKRAASKAAASSKPDPAVLAVEGDEEEEEMEDDEEVDEPGLAVRKRPAAKAPAEDEGCVMRERKQPIPAPPVVVTLPPKTSLGDEVVPPVAPAAVLPAVPVKPVVPEQPNTIEEAPPAAHVVQSQPNKKESHFDLPEMPAKRLRKAATVDESQISQWCCGID